MISVIHFKYLIGNFIRFLVNPNFHNYQNISTKQKLVNVGIYYLFFQFIVLGLLLWYPVEIAEKLGIYNELTSNESDFGVYYNIFTAIVLAPVIEEFIFRISLGYYRNSGYFKWLYYGSSIIFGWIHIINYHFDCSHYIYIPFITLTQTFSGFMFGYIRILYGFWYGVLLHTLFNTLGVIWFYTFGFDL